MVKKILFFLSGLITMHMHAQLLRPLGQGLQETQQGGADEVIASATDNNFLYVATRHANGLGKGQTITINKWNGFYWQQLPSVTFGDSSNVKCIAVFKGQVYIAGNFTVKNPLITNSKTIIRFNYVLNKWEGVINTIGGGGFSFLGGSGIINSMAVYKNQLLIGGYFYSIVNNDTTQHIIAYNGSNFTKCGLGTSANTGTNGMINSIIVLNDSVYIGGLFSKAGGLSSPNLAIITDSSLVWKPQFFSNTSTGISRLASFQGNLVVLGNDSKIYLRNNSSFQQISTGLNYSSITDLEEYNNELWASGSFMFSGNPSTIARYSVNWISANLPNPNTSNLFKYKNGLYLISTNEYAGNVRINKIAEIVFSRSRISGHVYQDVNHNCKYDINLDRPFTNKLIHISGFENYSITTDSEGYYSVLVTAGTSPYNLTLVKYKNWEIDSPCSKSTYSIVPVLNTSYESTDFALKSVATGADLKISIVPNGGYSSHRDFTEDYTLTYTNNGTQDISTLAGVELVFNKKLSNFSSFPLASVINGNKATWSFSNLHVGEQRSIQFSAKAMTDSFFVNENLDFIASTSYLADLDKSDNADTLVQRIAQSTPTPVLKDVYPLPLVNDSFSLVSAEKNEINYIIHFENTSLTDSIHKVIVIDTLDINSSIDYIQETGASHPYTTKIYNCPPSLGKGVIVWTFSNINLPPFESNDDVLNRGHIGFSIKFNSNLSLGTIIKNKAHVVFDYYDPLQTNNTYAKVSELTGINNKQIMNQSQGICVNPVSSQIVLLNDYESDASYQLFNSSGSLVASGLIKSKNINISNLTKGIYFIMINEKSKLTSQKIIIY